MGKDMSRRSTEDTQKTSKRGKTVCIGGHRETHTEAARRYRHAPIGPAGIRKTRDDASCRHADGDERTPGWHSPSGKVWRFPTKLHKRFPYDPARALWDALPENGELMFIKKEIPLPKCAARLCLLCLLLFAMAPDRKEPAPSAGGSETNRRIPGCLCPLLVAKLHDGCARRWRRWENVEGSSWVTSPTTC